MNGTLIAAPIAGTPGAAESRGRALVRQAGPADSAAIRDFVCGLSPRTQRLRFFACVAPPSTGLLRALCGGAGRADILLVTDGNDTVIAHGMAADTTAHGGLETSIGLVVADAWQRRGIGTLVLRALTTRAARRGVRNLVLEVLPDNDVMIGIIRRRWPDVPAQWTPDALEFRPSISASPSQRMSPGAIPVSHPSSSGGHRAAGRSAA
jgi:ribosomal protein S18 acetylase RimI-like enzyme